MRHILVIGGGVVGLASSWWLLEAGCRVTLLEQADVGTGTSYANGGQLSYRYVAPLADAGVPLKALGWMLERDGPLRFSPRLDVQQWRWLVDSSGTDPDSDTGRLLAALRIPDEMIGVLPNQTAAWAAAASGRGVAPATAHLVTQQLRRGELSLVELPGLPIDGCWHATMLERPQRSAAASSFRRFLGTPEAMHLMRSPTAGVPPSRFRPPVYVTIWS